MSGSSWGCLAVYDFVGLILGHFGPMFGPTAYSVSWRAICWPYLGPSGHIGSFQGYVGPIWGHVRKKQRVFPAWELNFCIFGAMLHAAFGTCDVQKTLYNRGKNCLRSNVEAFFQPQRESNAVKIHLGCILGLSCVMSGSSWGCLAVYDFVGLILGHFGPMFGPTKYSVSWRAICWPYLGPSGHIGSFQGYVGPIGVLGHLEGYVEILEGYKAICG